MDRHRATYISMIEVTEKIDTTFHLMKLISFFFATKIDKNKCNRDIVFPLLKKKNFLKKLRLLLLCVEKYFVQRNYIARKKKKKKINRRKLQDERERKQNDQGFGKDSNNRSTEIYIIFARTRMMSRLSTHHF